MRGTGGFRGAFRLVVDLSVWRSGHQKLKDEGWKIRRIRKAKRVGIRTTIEKKRFRAGGCR
jgi:hypothetical protein